MGEVCWQCCIMAYELDWVGRGRVYVFDLRGEDKELKGSKRRDLCLNLERVCEIFQLKSYGL